MKAPNNYLKLFGGTASNFGSADAFVLEYNKYNDGNKVRAVVYPVFGENFGAISLDT